MKREDPVVKETLEKIIPALNSILMARKAWDFIEKANEGLNGTGWILFAFGDGIKVVSSKEALAFGKKMWNLESVYGSSMGWDEDYPPRKKKLKKDRR